MQVAHHCCIACSLSIEHCPPLLYIYGLIRTGRISSIISTEVKTAEETAKRVRTGVGWMGLSGKLYEKRAVRVRYNPPRGQAPLYKAMRPPLRQYGV